MLSYTPLGMPWKNSGMSLHQPPVEPHSQGASSSMVGFFTKRMSLRPFFILLHNNHALTRWHTPVGCEADDPATAAAIFRLQLQAAPLSHPAAETSRH